MTGGTPDTARRALVSEVGRHTGLDERGREEENTRGEQNRERARDHQQGTQPKKRRRGEAHLPAREVAAKAWTSRKRQGTHDSSRREERGRQ